MSDINLSEIADRSGATKSLLNGFSVAGWAGVGGFASHLFGKNTLSGSMTAGTLVDLINESGSAGFLNQLSIYNTGGSTTKTLRVVITVDGTVIYDFTSAALAIGAGGIWAGIYNASSTFTLPNITYTNSIRVQFASSVTESNGFTCSLIRNQLH